MHFQLIKSGFSKWHLNKGLLKLCPGAWFCSFIPKINIFLSDVSNHIFSPLHKVWATSTARACVVLDNPTRKIIMPWHWYVFIRGNLDSYAAFSTFPPYRFSWSWHSFSALNIIEIVKLGWPEFTFHLALDLYKPSNDSLHKWILKIEIRKYKNTCTWFSEYGFSKFKWCVHSLFLAIFMR